MISDDRRQVMQSLAAQLAECWPDPSQPVVLKRTQFPRDRSEAYMVQDHMAALLAGGQCGWKVGATSARMRELDGHDDIIPGRILSSRCYIGASQHLPARLFPNARVETEFGFELIADPADCRGDFRAETVAPLLVLRPALEIIGNRYRSTEASKAENSLLTIADNGGGMAFVFGDPVPDWQRIDFPQQRIRLTVDGGSEAENFLGPMRCQPAEAVADLLNHLAGRGITMKKGDFVSTGAATVPQPITAGSRVEADFGEIGRMYLELE